MPMPMQRTIAPIAITVDTAMDTWKRYTIRPKMTAATMKSIETMATDALTALFSILTAPFSIVAPDVEATMAAKAATTRISVR